MNKSKYDFNQPILQGDTFWIYCNARQYWGTYKAALNEAGITLKKQEITSDYGHKIDWWPFREGWEEREYLALILRYLYENNIDISAHGLKNSPYFDIYTDALGHYGKYEGVLEYMEISRRGPECIGYPENQTTFEGIVDMYLTEDREKRCEYIQTMTEKITGKTNGLLGEIVKCPVIVDAANIAYVRDKPGKPSLENVRIIDSYLQEYGFPKENIIFIFDAAFI